MITAGSVETAVNTYGCAGIASYVMAGGLLAGSISGTGYILYMDNAYYLSILDGSAAASDSSYLYSYSTQAALFSAG